MGVSKSRGGKMQVLNAKIDEIIKRQDELDKRMGEIEVHTNDFLELKRTNATLHKEIEDLRSDIESQYQTSTQIQKESFDMMNSVYKEVLGFKKEDLVSQRAWVISLIGALGGGVTVTLIFQWLTSL